MPPASIASIFISYRRADTAGYARALYDALARRFGDERVFIDVDDIAAGQPFDAVIQRAVGHSEALLVLIGKSWRGPLDGGGWRIDDAADPVRREVAAALDRGMREIPLLVDGAAMPAPGQLPEPLRALAGLNALEIGHSRFAGDVDRLLAALGAGSPPTPAAAAATPVTQRRQRPRWRGWAPLTAGLLVLALTAGLALWQRARLAPAELPTGLPVVTARPPINGNWSAPVRYDWPGADHRERFAFGGEAGALHGSASFLGVPRGIVDGHVGADGVGFVTRTQEWVGGSGAAETVEHRYQGRLVGDELRVVMQTVGGASAHQPVEFIARRDAAAPAAAAAASTAGGR